MNTEITPLPTPGAETAHTHGRSRFAATCTLFALLTGAASGSLSALFLWSLDQATALRFTHAPLVFGLPFAGVMMAWCYNRWGKEAGRGNDLILERIRLQNGKVPPQMTPLIFGGSVLSHLVGASTGREGAAVQMGGGVAALLLQLTKLPPSYSRALLVAGVAAGFSSIFGTPLAGAVFAVEAAAPAQPLYRMLPIALTASFAGDFVCRAWGAKHAVYPIPESWGPALFTLKTLGALLLAGFIFGWAGRLFVSLHHGIRALYTRLSPHWWVPPLSGGLLLIGASQVPFFQDFLGLGTWSMRPEAVTIASAFAPGGATDFSWLLKLSLTALSLGAGFKGGEVTPLFFVGATLGNVVASHLHLDPSLFAALGFVSVFAGAAHTPLTGTLVAAELFGLSVVPLFAPVCWIAHRACGNAGIYSGQFPVAPSRPSSRARFEARQK